MADSSLPVFFRPAVPSRKILDAFATTQRYSRRLEERDRRDLRHAILFFAGLVFFVLTLLSCYLSVNSRTSSQIGNVPVTQTSSASQAE